LSAAPPAPAPIKRVVSRSSWVFFLLLLSEAIAGSITTLALVWTNDELIIAIGTTTAPGAKPATTNLKKRASLAPISKKN
jgi:hypothetical protein